MKRTLARITVSLMIAMLAACASHGLSTRDDDNAYFNASLGGVNHTGQYLYGFSVNGAFGGNASKYGGGNASVCCVRLPEVYRPGLTVDIEYDLLTNNGKDDNWKTKNGVPVEPYTEPGSLYVHFFPNDKIRVVVSSIYPFGKAHPIPYPVDPREKRDAGGQP